MGNLRQSMTDEEWNELSSEPEVKYSWNRSEIRNLIHKFCKDAMITDVPETDVWISKWINDNIK